MIWRIEMFGGLRAIRGDCVVRQFSTRRTASLLACLAFYPDRSHSRDILAEQLWPNEEENAVRNRLRQALTSLRHILEPDGLQTGAVLIASRSDVRLAPSSFSTDVGEFECALSEARAACGLSSRIDLLERAVSLYGQGLLPDYSDEWVCQERIRLEEAHTQALTLLTEARRTSGDSAGAIEAARRLVEMDLLREEFHLLLIRCFFAAGRVSDAIKQFRLMEKQLEEELGEKPSEETLRHFMEMKQNIYPPPASGVFNNPLTAAPGQNMQNDIEPEGGAVPLDSPYYIVRPVDEQLRAAIGRRDSIIRVKGPRQTGKSSLLARGLEAAKQQNIRCVICDLQKLTSPQLATADSLLLALADNMVEQLGLGIDVYANWDAARGWNVNFERILRREILDRLDAPLVWALDEIDRLFGMPYSSEVFGLFRSWHNERTFNPDGPWQKLTIAIAYASEAHLFIPDLNQSPFNVGIRLLLEDFAPAEVAEVNRRYHSLLSSEEIEQCYALVGGNPYLVRLAIHAMLSRGLSLPELEAETERPDGLFSDHLRRVVATVKQDRHLYEAVRSMLRGEPCPSADSFYRLHSAGLISGNNEREARPRCEIYRRALEKWLL
jgi:DNA-binding SARP family transcriptional activator